VTWIGVQLLVWTCEFGLVYPKPKKTGHVTPTTPVRGSLLSQG